MPIDLTVLCREVRPERTAILFGAGSSVPSGGLTGKALAKEIAEQFGINFDPTLALAEIATLAELKSARREIMQFLQQKLEKLKPTAGLLNLPQYSWKDIFTTNYDTLIEQTFARAKKELQVYSSNFDFDVDNTRGVTSLMKLHGTIGQDRALGHRASLVLTTDDYQLAEHYRELVFDRLMHETSKSDVLIIGHSLTDPDLNLVLDEAMRRKHQSGASGKLYVLSYERDENRALLLEKRGFQVCFASLDDLFATLAKEGPATRTVHVDAGDLLGRVPGLRPVTIDVNHAVEHEVPDALQLFNGRPATYGDIRAELTFQRDLAGLLETHLAGAGNAVAYVLGPAGFGKTSMARQVVTSLVKRGFKAFEHKPDYELDGAAWRSIAVHCQKQNTNAVLFVDDAHLHLRALDQVVDEIAKSANPNFKVLLTSTAGHWHPRSKTPSFFKVGKEHSIQRLTATEIDSLLDLFDRKKEISTLVEPTFGGFSRQAKLQRLVERCRSDMFVCLKNIFSSADGLDEIILQDYATLDDALQGIYKTVAAMEASNIRVHRQLVMRILGIRADFIRGILDRLPGIISEYEISEKDGIYGWRGRHQVISEIVLKYKFHEQTELFTLYERVIDNINPSYEIERMTLNELCDVQSGIGRLRNRDEQNFLYRKMISISPSQRPPRHRLIRNLIDAHQFDAAANEIRIFERELKRDAPVLRYRAMLLIERAKSVSGILAEDRLAMLSDANQAVERGLEQFPSDRGLHNIFCEIGLEVVRMSGKWDVYDKALDRLRQSEREYLDPEMARMITRVQLRAEQLMKKEA